MKLKVGQSLASVVDATTVLVVKATDAEYSVTCGGAAMVDPKQAASMAGEAPTPAPGAGVQLGKRYTDEDGTLELLCTKSGTHPLAASGVILSLKATTALPASD
jgi:hypothetical protein